MDIVEPHITRVVPLFRALHNYHAAFSPGTYHADGPDAAYLAILEDKCGEGGRIFAHDAGWGLVSYLLAWPDVIERDALRCEIRSIRIDHLYVVPDARGQRLGQALIARVEAWVEELGFDSWNVAYHAENPGAVEFYASLGTVPWKGINVKRMR